jgi:hypothetical protein
MKKYFNSKNIICTTFKTIFLIYSLGRSQLFEYIVRLLKIDFNKRKNVKKIKKNCHQSKLQITLIILKNNIFFYLIKNSFNKQVNLYHTLLHLIKYSITINYKVPKFFIFKTSQ